jgi:hypothetical protein
MSNNFRNAELLGKLERHPLRASLARALDASELFAGDIEHIKLDRRLSAEGRDDARRSKLRAAARDLRDAKAPLAEMQKKLDAKSKAVQIPPFDRSDDYGLKLRMELRQTLKTADPGQRALLLAKPAYADALLETEPEASGLFLAENFVGTISPEIQRDRDIVAAAKEKRLEGLFSAELAEIAELKETIDSANMIFDLALVDLKLHSEMNDRTFTEFTTPIMTRKNAPWLKRSTNSEGRELFYVFDPKDYAHPRIASQDEIRDGVEYPDIASYQASRAA